MRAVGSEAAALADVSTRGLGDSLHELISELYPICRSITGDGLRETLRRLQQLIPLEIHEVRTGTEVFDWTVPKEWNISAAWIRDPDGTTVVDFDQSNLHVVSYSVPVKGSFTLAELKPHLFTLPDHPDWIPYRTSYYHETWGFCLPHSRLQSLRDGEYEVCIDSSLESGSLTYGEYYLHGDTEAEVLISCHACHPSLANDNLSGVAIGAYLARLLSEIDRRYSYRFLFIPGTIGSITWLARNESAVGNVRHGLVLAGLGDAGAFHYKRSQRGEAEIDRAVTQVLKARGPCGIEDFSPYGYDERQYCSPGFDLPVGCLMRTPYGRYPEYHTSADDLDFVTADSLGESLDVCLDIVRLLEANRAYVNLNPRCEPQLGKRGLYDTIGGRQATPEDRLALLWVLNQSNGDRTLLDIAERSGLRFELIAEAAGALCDAGLLAPTGSGPRDV